jgi:hypothetical protein
MIRPQMRVQLYKGLMKVYMNQSGIYEGSIVVVENKVKDQAAGLEIAESLFCGYQAFKRHIKDIAEGRFTDKGATLT